MARRKPVGGHEAVEQRVKQDGEALKPRKPRGPVKSFEERQAERIAYHEHLAEKQRRALEERAEARLQAEVEKVHRHVESLNGLVEMVERASPESLRRALSERDIPLTLPQMESNAQRAIALLQEQLMRIERHNQSPSALEPDPVLDVLAGS